MVASDYVLDALLVLGLCMLGDLSWRFGVCRCFALHVRPEGSVLCGLVVRLFVYFSLLCWCITLCSVLSLVGCLC